MKQHPVRMLFHLRLVLCKKRYRIEGERGMAKGLPMKLYVRIAGEIRTLIEEGHLQPGDKLPTLAALAEQFACSRATVREALGALRGQGLVEFRHGDGTYVRTATVEMWMEPLEAAILLGAQQIQSLVEMQTVILAGIASYAAERRSMSDFSPLAHALFNLECATPHSEEAVASELAFYTTLASCSGNAVLENAFRILQEAMRSSLRVLNPRFSIGIKTCHAVYDAVQMGDAQRAREVVYTYGAAVVRALKANATRA